VQQLDWRRRRYEEPGGVFRTKNYVGRQAGSKREVNMLKAILVID
jgi:hypothetical protein